MNRFLFRMTAVILAPLLWWRSRPALVRHALAGRRFTPAPPPQGDRIRVGVVQLEAHLFRSAAEYAQTMYGLTRQAVEAGAQLMVFPEDSGGYLLAGLIPGIDQLIPAPGRISAHIRKVGMSDLLRLLAPAARRIFETTFSSLAAGFGVHLGAGTVCLPDGRGNLLRVGYFFGPDGRTIGTQAQTHLSPREAAWGMSRGEEIRVFETALGRISIPICIDHSYFEPQRIAWLRGAEIMIAPVGDAAEYNFWLHARGLWGRVQESPAYGILACLVGHELGITTGGRSGVYAPLEMTPSGDGIIAQAQDADRPEVVVADLDLAALRRFRREHAPQFNLALYRRYLPAAYEAYRRTEQDGRRVVSPASSKV
ncbi:MAG: nitrilase [Chloroflexi bacterium]|nr:nitrilase [Chloroflexota bacterium]